jgi:hypothetical protein
VSLFKNLAKAATAIGTGGTSLLVEKGEKKLFGAITPKTANADLSGAQTTPEQAKLQEGQAKLLDELVSSMKQNRTDSAAVSEEAKKAAEAGKKRDAIFTPLLLKSLGYNGSFDGDGNLSSISKMSEEDLVGQMSPLEKQQYQVAQEMSARQLKALRGELDVDPALTADIQNNQAILEETLSRTLGPNWRNSTVGNAAFNDFQEHATSIIESARRGEIAQGVGLISTSLDNVAKTNSFQTGTLNAAASVAESPFSNNLARKTAALQPNINAINGSMPLLTGFTQAQLPFSVDKEIAAKAAMQGADQEFAANQSKSNFVKDLFGTVLGAGTSAILGKSKVA